MGWNKSSLCKIEHAGVCTAVRPHADGETVNVKIICGENLLK